MDHITSDTLRGQAGRLLGDEPWAVATVRDDQVTLATHDCRPTDRFEIGSISKGVTGLLYDEAVDRAEVRPYDRLGEHLPLGDSAVAQVRLSALATHRSGLPTLPPGQAVTRSLRWLVLQRNPYGDDLETLLRATRPVRVGRARPRYSNLGFQLLGHAVAAAAGTSYADLVRERVAKPLGLDSVTVPAGAAELEDRDLVGRSRWGRRSAPWTGEGLGPAGGIRMDLQDAAALAQALAQDRAPGLGALEPTADFGLRGVRIGAAWLTSPRPGGDVVWHNGGTGGFRTWLGIDRTRRLAVVVLRARYRAADPAGWRLMGDLRAEVTE
ncbi:MAG: serine hydrolase [Aeromicrobium erythreum]